MTWGQSPARTAGNASGSTHRALARPQASRLRSLGFDSSTSVKPAAPGGARLSGGTPWRIAFVSVSFYRRWAAR